MPGIAVEPHRSEDRRFVREMLEVGTSASFPDLERLGRITRRERLDAAFERHWDREDKLVWIARVGDPGVAAGAVWLEPGHHPITELPDFTVVVLAVAEAHRGRGVGRALMETARAHAIAAGCPRLRLFVAAGNEPARRLYASLGYVDQTIEMRWER